MILTDHVVLVDENDQVLGIEEKIKAHELALLHRAFSVFIYRRQEDLIEFLLQQRHQNKYHCGGLWTNTCCSHPRLNEDVLLAGQRRLNEELSINIPLNFVDTFIYKTKFDNGLTEHELDHVLVGEFDASQTIVLEPTEAQAFRWITVEQLEEELSAKPSCFTPWFKNAFDLVLEEICPKL